MNARTMTRIGFSPVAVAMLAGSLLVNIALGVVALSASGNLPSISAEPTRAVRPKAYYVEGQGEGWLGRPVPAAATVVEMNAAQPSSRHPRFNEINQLPDVAPAATPATASPRMREINLMPGDDEATSALTSAQRVALPYINGWRFDTVLVPEH